MARASGPVALPDPRPRPEVGLDFPREWVQFIDPADPEHLIRADLTWLLSRWNCLFGRSCFGVIAGRADEGCCSHGAFFTDADDEKRVRQAVRRLNRQTWQHYRRGFERWTEMDTVDGETPARRTALRDGGGPCVFHNDPDFPGGHGCALHAQAVRDGVHPMDYKPEVCWQIPIRREQEWITRPDETQLLLTTLGEFDRRGWGAGGHDHYWWCTGAPEAHTGAEPVYVSYRAELVALIGEPAYRTLAELCEQRKRQGQVAPHPATVAAADLPRPSGPAGAPGRPDTAGQTDTAGERGAARRAGQRPAKVRR